MPKKPEDLIIRPVSVADAPALHRLATLPGTMWGTAQLPSQTVEQNQHRLEGIATDRDTHWFVAELDGELVGSASMRTLRGRRRHTGNIGLMVHDDHVNRGIGRALMEALLDVADNFLGLKRLELDAVTDNAPAIHLYESLGFQHEGVMRCALFRGGVFVDLLMMGRVRD
jgi:putative acetyltransferase